jgi:hypothetical protein
MAYLEIDDEPTPLPTPEAALAEVADWKRRVDALYDEIVCWLPVGEGYEVDRSRLLPRHENMLKALGLPGYEIPLMRIRRNGKDVLLFQPDGRWVLFTRGRVNLFVGNIRAGDRLLAKEAEAKGAEWTYWAGDNWQQGGDPWSKERLLTILSEAQ